jgi:hypothetical protein
MLYFQVLNPCELRYFYDITSIRAKFETLLKLLFFQIQTPTLLESQLKITHGKTSRLYRIDVYLDITHRF